MQSLSASEQVTAMFTFQHQTRICSAMKGPMAKHLNKLDINYVVILVGLVTYEEGKWTETLKRGNIIEHG